MKKIYRPTFDFTSSKRSERGHFFVIILPKSYLNLHTFIHMHYENQSNGSQFIRNKLHIHVSNLSTSEQGKFLVRYFRVKS